MQKNNNNESDQESVFINPHAIFLDGDEEEDMDSELIDQKRYENKDCAVNEEERQEDEDFTICNINSITQEMLEQLIAKICKERSEIKELHCEKDAMHLECRILRETNSSSNCNTKKSRCASGKDKQESDVNRLIEELNKKNAQCVRLQEDIDDLTNEHDRIEEQYEEKTMHVNRLEEEIANCFQKIKKCEKRIKATEQRFDVMCNGSSRFE